MQVDHLQSTVEEAGEQDFPKILELLGSAGLTTDGLDDAELWVIRSNGDVIGCIGLEIWDKKQGLLRSLAVSRGLRKAGLGSALVQYVLEVARQRKLCEVFLLTKIPEYYLRFGFEPVDRNSVIGGVLRSAEFRGACLETAAVMHIAI